MLVSSSINHGQVPKGPGEILKRNRLMSRRRRASKRQTAPDPIYQSVTLAKFINKLMYGGKKSVARSIVYRALEKFAQRVKTDNPSGSLRTSYRKFKAFFRSQDPEDRWSQLPGARRDPERSTHRDGNAVDHLSIPERSRAELWKKPWPAN